MIMHKPYFKNLTETLFFLNIAKILQKPKLRFSSSQKIKFADIKHNC